MGLSGIWLFPYRVSQYGGAAFLIPYLFFVVVLGITGVIGEMAFGRAMGTGPMGAFSKALEMRGVKNGDKIGRVIGIIPVLGALGIAIGYAVVIGWFIKYLIEAACGTITLAVMAFGVSRGIERLNKNHDAHFLYSVLVLLCLRCHAAGRARRLCLFVCAPLGGAR